MPGGCFEASRLNPRLLQMSASIELRTHFARWRCLRAKALSGRKASAVPVQLPSKPVTREPPGQQEMELHTISPPLESVTFESSGAPYALCSIVTISYLEATECLGRFCVGL